MKTIVSALIAAALLLVIASLVHAGPDEDARAALALAKIKALVKATCSCGASCPCDAGQCGDSTCPTAASACFMGRIHMGYGQYLLTPANGKSIALRLTTAEQEDDCKTLVMSTREVQVCGSLSADGALLTVASIGGRTTADAPSASQQRQIDALLPGTVYQIRRPDGTLSEPRTKPGAAASGSTPATFRALPMRWSAGPQMCSPGGA